ncbi:c-type cytochrome [Phototrophicus methaneseepsis]|uniref:C-type cytochrome n=1 Tax=Phototrophicus methaneseepsis TaxID=2710758 RepID=A0A7S8IFT7_9CHLR|nr:c-type cytochrome [Phototrophicus methaneseepsis]QPC83956.1 c-type cytochrome [Phototrophicus methaneseepsis]
MMKTIFGLCLISFLLAGCLPADVMTKLGLLQSSQSTQPSIDEALLEEGRASYLHNYCGSCHQLTAANTRGTFGPSHDHIGTIAAERVTTEGYTGTATTAEGYLRESLLDPLVYSAPGYEATNHHMPAYTHLPDEEIDALVYFLLHQE